MNHIKRKETEEVNEAYNDNLGNDSFRWEMTGEDCTGFGDCDYYEYVMFPYKEPAEDFYWVIPKGRKYQLFTDRYSERPVEVFTSLKKAKQYAEELWLKEHEDYEIDESLNESEKPDKKIVVGSTSGGIAVDFKPLSDKVSEVYNYLYNNNDTITVGNNRYSVSSLSYDFDGYMQVNDEFKRLVREFTKWNGDYLSSDREAAAFIFALDALYPNIWDEIDKYTVNE